MSGECRSGKARIELLPILGGVRRFQIPDSRFQTKSSDKWRAGKTRIELLPILAAGQRLEIADFSRIAPARGSRHPTPDARHPTPDTRHLTPETCTSLLTGGSRYGSLHAWSHERSYLKTWESVRRSQRQKGKCAENRKKMLNSGNELKDVLQTKDLANFGAKNELVFERK